jgi:hypothetical protein
MEFIHSYVSASSSVAAILRQEELVYVCEWREASNTRHSIYKDDFSWVLCAESAVLFDCVKEGVEFKWFEENGNLGARAGQEIKNEPISSDVMGERQERNWETHLLILLYTVVSTNKPCKRPMCASAFSAILIRAISSEALLPFLGIVSPSLD